MEHGRWVRVAPRGPFRQYIVEELGGLIHLKRIDDSTCIVPDKKRANVSRMEGECDHRGQSRSGELFSPKVGYLERCKGLAIKVIGNNLAALCPKQRIVERRVAVEGSDLSRQGMRVDQLLLLQGIDLQVVPRVYT